MAYFEWDPALETGNAEIDEQHRGLFELANRLQDAVQTCTIGSDGRCESDEDSLADAIYGLTDYCVQHFADEEDLMAASGYPEYPTHRALHEQLSGETLKYAAKYFNEDNIVPEELAAFFTQWLSNHIRTQDMRLVTFLRTRGAS